MHCAMNETRALLRVLVIGAWLWLSSCAVGPNFERPKAPATPTYDKPERPASDAAPAGAVHMTPGADVPAQWWQLFQSPMLDQTLREAIAGSPTMASAQATLAAAREAVIIARAGYLPRLSATAGAQHSASAGSLG